jgi:lysophospholipase L1-like esterase
MILILLFLKLLINPDYDCTRKLSKQPMKKELRFGFSLLLILIFTGAGTKPSLTYLTFMTDPTYTYLALGDSYTIGESVLLQENFPYQTVQLLRNAGFEFKVPEIIAKTGWTTDELQTAINNHKFLPKYDFVTLLIGVNNQYRGRSVENYKPEFESLLKQTIQFAGNDTNHVFVLSIPDWGATPFAEGRDRKQIAEEIDEYNAANKAMAEKYKVIYIDSTPGTREVANDPTLVATDGLHPSAKDYRRWAAKLADKIKSRLQ